MANMVTNRMQIHTLMGKTEDYEIHSLFQDMAFADGRLWISSISTEYHMNQGIQVPDRNSWNLKALRQHLDGTKRDKTPEGLNNLHITISWDSAWGALNPFTDSSFEKLTQHDVRWWYEEPGMNFTGFDHWQCGEHIASDYRDMWEHPVPEYFADEVGGALEPFFHPLGYCSDQQREFDSASVDQLEDMYRRRYEQDKQWRTSRVQHLESKLLNCSDDAEREQIVLTLDRARARLELPYVTGYSVLNPPTREAQEVREVIKPAGFNV